MHVRTVRCSGSHSYIIPENAISNRGGLRLRHCSGGHEYLTSSDAWLQFAVGLRYHVKLKLAQTEGNASAKGANVQDMYVKHKHVAA